MLLADDFGPLTETQRAMLSQASGSTERMIGLINDTMDVVKTEGSTVAYTLSPLLFSSLIEESIKDFTSEASAKDMHIRYAPPEAPIIVHADTDKLRIVIHNLLENAIKYGSKGTDIVVDLRVDDGRVYLSVTDHGITVPSSEQRNLFTKFFRATTARDYPGVGLGLYASKHIVERHGGTLTCTSTPSDGTTFTIALPLG